jgi:dTDP-4-amino-4,6-dideoxygalactose transaminase
VKAGSGLNIQQIVLKPRRSAGAKTKERKRAARVLGAEVAEDLFNRGLCLPSGTSMTNIDLDRIIPVIRSCRK